MALRVPISFEFYPPKTDEQRAATGPHRGQAEGALARLRVVHVRCRRLDAVATRPKPCSACAQTHGLNAAPHISCMGGTREEIRALLKLYRALGCKRVVALRGDMPSGMAPHGRLPLRLRPRRVHPRRARRLLPHRSRLLSGNASAGRRSPSPTCSHFKAKVDAGADGAITQYFYNADAYFRFVDDARKLGIDDPDRAGHHADLQLHAASSASPKPAARRFRAGSASACRPTATMARASASSRRSSSRDLCRRLIDGGAPALHFYTLNLSKPTLNVIELLD